jgi:hypothetical protein
MATISGLIDRLAPDCVERLQRAAKMRFNEAAMLQGNHRLAAVYWYGYCVEMCLVAAYFRRAGFQPHDPIDRDTRGLRMKFARGKGLMESDPHPLVGWAKYLRWQAMQKGFDDRRDRLLIEAIAWAEKAYRHWRPELRYKVADVAEACLDEIRQAAEWFMNNQSRLMRG